MPSATRAHSSDSMAPSSAIERIGPARLRTTSQSKAGTPKGGSVRGMPPNRLPMVSTFRPNTLTARVPRTITTTVPGMRASHRRQRASLSL